MHRVFYPAFRGIIIRGIERKDIFRTNKDRDDLLTCLDNLLIVTNTSCYTCQITNRIKTE